MIVNSQRLTESVAEDAALAWLDSLGWRIPHGPDMAPDASGVERADYSDVVLEQRLRSAYDIDRGGPICHLRRKSY